MNEPIMQYRVLYELDGKKHMDLMCGVTPYKEKALGSVERLKRDNPRCKNIRIEERTAIFSEWGVIG